ncbi:MAG TPA: hypothetical protein VHM02_02350, partial [Thermoanaerobaculia bacterium]|nr:hypothetical protein [Thermoanaerobaculia bacterium]
RRRDDGALAGLAWLEGDAPRGMAVRLARWDGLRWAPAETVAAPGPGSQLALVATALADGTLLLAWSAFDGSDDEVVWSRRDGDAWSRPERIAADNAVPDVTPALVAVDGGALAAWATFADGAYRVVLARYADGRWSAPRPVAPPGTAFPGFEPATVAPRLLVRRAAPAGWLLIELDAEHRPVRQAMAEGTGSVRPSIVEDVGDGVHFVWAGSDLVPYGAWEAPERRATPETAP